MIISSNKNDMGTDQEDDDDDDDEEMIIISKLQHVLAAKSRRLQYTSSPVISHHVPSLSLLSSSPDRASVPFSWEEEPGKPKHYLLPQPYNSKRLGLPPRMILPAEITKRPLVSDHHRRRLAGLKRWFRRRKERAGDVVGNSSFVFPSSENDAEVDMRIIRTGGFHCLSDVTKCYFWVNFLLLS